MNGTDPVEAVTYSTFKKLNLETTLSKLSRVLDTEHYALVVHNQRLCEYEIIFIMMRPSLSRQKRRAFACKIPFTTKEELKREKER